MTTTANKHGLRAAGVARTRKASQNTPLPPRPGQIEDAKEAIEETRPQYGTMTVDQLKAVAKEKGIKPLPRTKGALLEALLGWDRRLEDIRQIAVEIKEKTARTRAKATEAKVDAAFSQESAKPDAIDSAFAETAPETAPSATEKPKKRGALPKVAGGVKCSLCGAEAAADGTGRPIVLRHADDCPEGKPDVSAGQALDPKGLAKARRMAEKTAKFGWEAKIEGEDSIVTITLTRGDEVLSATWDSGIYEYASSTYVIGHRVTKPRNASGMVKFASRAPEEARKELDRVVSNKAFRKKAEPAEVTARRKRIDFNPQELDDSELVEKILGRRVTWLNRLTGNEETDWVLAKAKRFIRVQEVSGERVVQFLGQQGFRAFRAEDILRVGRT